MRANRLHRLTSCPPRCRPQLGGSGNDGQGNGREAIWERLFGQAVSIDIVVLRLGAGKCDLPSLILLAAAVKSSGCKTAPTIHVDIDGLRSMGTLVTRPGIRALWRQPEGPDGNGDAWRWRASSACWPAGRRRTAPRRGGGQTAARMRGRRRKRTSRRTPQRRRLPARWRWVWRSDSVPCCVVIPALRLALPTTALPPPLPAQHQDAETYAFVSAFVVVLPLAGFAGHRLAARLSSAVGERALLSIAACLLAGLSLVVLATRGPRRPGSATHSCGCWPWQSPGGWPPPAPWARCSPAMRQPGSCRHRARPGRLPD